VKEFGNGKLYQAVVSEPAKADTYYIQALFVEPQKKGPRIVSIGGMCSTCGGSGKLASGKNGLCPECQGGVRLIESGTESAVGDLGAPTAVKKLERPTSEMSQPDYDSYK